MFRAKAAACLLRGLEGAGYKSQPSDKYWKAQLESPLLDRINKQRERKLYSKA